MFGTNEVVGKKWFKEAGDRLFVTSIFYSIQGEGPFMGAPAVFVRLGKCNLDCSFCDALFDQGDWMTPEQVDSKIDEVLAAKGIDQSTGMLLVITGGEPLLQDAAVPWMHDRMSRGNLVQIETNGILSMDELDPGIHVVCSPKISEKSGRYLKPSEANMGRIDYFKFLVSADPASPYHQVPDWAPRTLRTFVSPINVYLDAPREMKIFLVRDAQTKGIDFRSSKGEVASFWEEGTFDIAQNRLNHEYAGELAVTEGFRVSLQMHNLLSMA
ncbi:QueE-like radical SAM domain [Acidovorax phage ACP17]|uniref:Queuosine biosynthesis protein n=1 Tax=Acidovorax phage ACP17 TaxID=2010329 RepID=A0A218M2Y8_9CAUD|nr:QueE-like radical SAM domain [Acidovorax phage ACP17]ASD50406.1 queuosine biosynthesis protein [Acidovorax phage ACP17]